MDRFFARRRSRLASLAVPPQRALPPGRSVCGLLAGLVALAWGASFALAAAPAIRFNVVDGKLCARATLQGPTKAIAANVVIDLGQRVPLLVHEKTGKLLKIERGTPVVLQFEDVELRNVPGTPTALRALEELTRDYAAELGEIPAVAILGLPALANYAVQLDIGENTLRLLGPDDPAPVDSTAPADNAICTLPYEEQGASYWLSGTGPDGFALRVRFATSETDTLIDSTAADLLGAPAGELDTVTLGLLNVARFVALRPQDLSTMPAPRPDIVLGTGLLAHWRVTLYPQAKRIRLEGIRPPHFPAEERTYFAARVREDAGAIEAFLTQNPTSRLAHEAAGELLRLRLDEYPPAAETIARAVRACATTTREDRRASDMLALADELLNSRRDDRYELAEVVVKIGLEYATAGANGVEAHGLRARLGRIALHRDDLKEARRQLLSAAFGLPKDPLVNLWLGELYEKMGKPARAWSRYLQAALARERPPGALDGLDRLNRDAPFRASFTMGDAEQLLEGRSVEFHPAERAASGPAGTAASPVRLVELFTCIDEPATLAAELALGGLGEYYAPGQAALVEYHLSNPAPDPLTTDASVTRAAFYAIEKVPVAYFNGSAPNNSGGKDSDAPRLFAEYVAAGAGSAEGAAKWSVGGQVALAGDVLTGKIELNGPAGGPELRLHVLLCERAAMALGGNGLILHHYVARAAVSPPDGFAVAAEAGKRAYDIRVDYAAVRAGVERTVAQLEKDRDVTFTMKPTYVDPAAGVIIAFVQDRSSRQVWGACALRPEPKE